MKALTDVGLLFGRYARSMLRTPMWLAFTFVGPILYLALFTPLLQSLDAVSAGHALDLFLPGILAFVAYGAGVGPGFSLIFDLRAGVVERLRVTPASRFAILVGPILASLVLTLTADVVLVAGGALFGFTVHGGGLAVLAGLLALLQIGSAAFFSAAAIGAREINGFAALTNGLNLPVLLLGGVLLPISLGPWWLADLAHIDPLYYVVRAARTLAAGSFAPADVWQAFLIVGALTVLVLVWATRVLRRAVA